MNKNTETEQIYKTILIVWFALLMSQFLFLVVVYFAKPEVFRFDLRQPVLGENAIIVVTLAVVSAIIFGVSFVVRNKFLERAVREQNVGFVQMAVINGCALCEAISLLGLLLAFAFDYQYFFLFMIVGIVGVLLHFPRRDSVIAARFKV